MTSNKAPKKKLLKILVVVLLVCAVGLVLRKPPDTSHTAQADLTTFEVQLGNLIIDVLEAGSIDASESQVIKSQVEGRTTIISIASEGTIITQEDVENKKVLVELDSSALRDRETEQEISVQGAKATLTDAEESYAIQLKQNESNLKKGELTQKFAWMDLEKYLGRDLVQDYRDQKVGIDDLISHPQLGGEALQKLRELENTKFLEQEERLQAREKLNWTIVLSASGYVSSSVLDEDRLALERANVALAKASTAIDLFSRYEIQKEAEKLLSDFEEARRELSRIEAQNRSELARADAKLQSSSATFVRTVDQLNKIREQIQNTRVVATQTGLVTYPDDRRNRDRAIEEGAEVYERQEIIRIPNLTTMIAKTKIHESVVARIKEGQKAIISIDALPERELHGKVKKVGLLPDSENRWYNPELKVYETEVTLEETVPELKPGMSAKVRIVIEEHKDVLKIPLQAVVSRRHANFCFVLAAGQPEIREITTGDYNDNFVEVKTGLSAGDRVVLNLAGLLPQFESILKEKSNEKGSRKGQQGLEPPLEEGVEPPAPGKEPKEGEPVASVSEVDRKKPL